LQEELEENKDADDEAPGLGGEIARSERERRVLELTGGRKSIVKLKSGGEVRYEGKELKIDGTREEIAEWRGAARDLRKRMITETRKASHARQQAAAEVAARKRATIRTKLMTLGLKGTTRGGTISFNRAAGAQSLVLGALPLDGTREYPFYMDYAGASQARITLTCIRAGAAMVLQAVLGLLAAAVAGWVLWQRVKFGLPGILIAAVTIIFSMRVINQAVHQYLVMILIGLIFAVVAAAIAAPIRRRCAAARNESA